MTDDYQKDRERRDREYLEELILALLFLVGRETDLLCGGQSTVPQWREQIITGIKDGHSANGSDFNQSSVTLVDEIGGEVIGAGEDRFLVDFATDIQTGRYTDEVGELKSSSIKSRADLYAYKLRATAMQAFVQQSPVGTEFDWILDDGAHHCEGNGGMNCPDIAGSGPYTSDTIPTYPASGATPCLTNCRCSLVRKTDGYQFG